MAELGKKARERLTAIFARLGSESEGERENAWAALDNLLRRNGRTWNDLTELLRDPATAASWSHLDHEDYNDGQAATTHEPAGRVTPLDLVRHILPQFIWLKSDAYYNAVALWVVASHVYERFSVFPRLTLLSPVWGCGKSQVLSVLSRLCPRAHKTDSITPAGIYHAVHKHRQTLLIDEADNLGLRNDGALRRVFNSGYAAGGTVTTALETYRTFAPMAISAIDPPPLPPPLLDRSIILRMQRRLPRAPRLAKVMEGDPDLQTIEQELRRWAAGKPTLNTEPPLPAELANRKADKWEPLVAVADHFGPYWGELAREAALAISREQVDEAPAILLLVDIRAVFDTLGVDYIYTKALVDRLRGLEGVGDWSAITASKIAALLKGFGIAPKTIWPPRRSPADKGAKGYRRSWFEAAWGIYVPEDVTASQASAAKRLRAV
jgi:hypothetical protein